MTVELAWWIMGAGFLLGVAFTAGAAIVVYGTAQLIDWLRPLRGE